MAGRFKAGGFTLVEAVVGVTLIGVGVAYTIGALTKFNQIAATSRNATGAAAVVMNQVDLFQSMSPFNPQPSKNQIPRDADGTYDMTVGTHTIAYKDPSTGVVIEPTRPVASLSRARTLDLCQCRRSHRGNWIGGERRWAACLSKRYPDLLALANDCTNVGRGHDRRNYRQRHDDVHGDRHFHRLHA